MTREEAIKWVKFDLESWEHQCLSYHPTKEALKMAIEALKQPEQKTGKWKVDWDWGIATCTNCNHDYDDADNGYLLGNEMKYCPFCGAKMEG